MGKTYNFAELAKQAGSSGEPLPEGNYDFVVEKVNTGETQAGDDKLGLFLRVEGGPHDGESQWINLTFGEKAAPVSARQLQQIGVSIAEAEIGGIAAAVDGARFSADIKHNKSGDRTFVNLNNIKGGAGPAPAAPSGPVPPPAPGGPGF